MEHQEKLSRTELRAKQEENLRLAREEFADRLRKARGEHPQALAPWINVERLYLETLLARNLDHVEQECWELLGPKPPKPVGGDAEPDLQQQLDEILRTRHLVTLANLAARKGAKPELIDRLLSYVDQAIAQQTRRSRKQVLPAGSTSSINCWWPWIGRRNWQRTCSSGSESTIPTTAGESRWATCWPSRARSPRPSRCSRRSRPTTSSAPASIARWPTGTWSLDRRDRHEEALIAVFKTMEEWRLSNWISAKLQPWQRRDGQLPPELDKDVLRVFAALFRKSGSPQNYLWRLREFYRATRDFRLLAGPGRRGGRPHGRQGLSVPARHGRRCSRRSATRRPSTRSSSRLARSASGRRPPSTSGRWTCWRCWSSAGRRRCSTSPARTSTRPLAALQRAFKRRVVAGRAAADGRSPGRPGQDRQPKLADEQIRQLETLHDGAAAGTLDRLHIGHRRANCLWNYGRNDEAIDLLQAVLDEYQAAQGGVLPADANDALDSFVSYLEARGHHARGEKVLFGAAQASGQSAADLLAQPAALSALRERDRQRRRRLAGQRPGALPSGPAEDPGRTGHARPQPPLRPGQPAVRRLPRCPRQEARRRVDDLRAFAFKRLPEVLKRQTNNYQSMVGRVADTLHDLAGARDGLAFLVERIEAEPAWLRYNNQDGWNQHGWRLGQWRTEAKELDAGLEARLLKIVLDGTAPGPRVAPVAQPRHVPSPQQLLLGGEGGRLRQAAEEVYEKRKTSGAAVPYIAEYLYHGLDHFDRAIEILLIAHGEKRLDEDGQSQTGPLPARAEPLRRVDRHPAAAGRAAAGQHAVPRLADARLLPDQAAGGAAGPAEADRRVLPPGRPLDGGPAGRAGPELPGEPALRAVGRLLRGADPAAPADAARTAASATARSRRTTATWPGPTPA